jgi:molybdenum cofactor biosynthesis enzyme MoaA
MQWKFSPEDVLNGRVDYTIEEFRDDLKVEVLDNFQGMPRQEIEIIFQIAYDVCFCSALRQDLQGLLEHCLAQGLGIDARYLELIRESNATNIEMLKALFARRIAHLKQQGLSNEAALARLQEDHRQMSAISGDGSEQ